MSVFKSYLRSLMRQLKELKKAVDNDDKEAVLRIVNEIMEDTQKGIEDN